MDTDLIQVDENIFLTKVVANIYSASIRSIKPFSQRCNSLQCSSGRLLDLYTTERAPCISIPLK